MVQSLCFSSVCSFKAPEKPGVFVGSSVAGKVFRVSKSSQTSEESRFQSLVVKATDSTKSSKPETENTKSSKKRSIVCPDCDGNGAILCTQCKGTGVNSVDHFNGQFKAGGLCWLCRGKRDILCGNCNGAGFLGGFMSSFDD